MQAKCTHFALARDSSCKRSSQISEAVQRASFHPSASFSARSHFGDKTPSGLTSQPVIPAVQTKHTDCQSKQTSLLTTKFCLHNFSPIKKNNKVQSPLHPQWNSLWRREQDPMEKQLATLLTGEFNKGVCTAEIGKEEKPSIENPNQSWKPASTPP